MSFSLHSEVIGNFIITALIHLALYQCPKLVYLPSDLLGSCLDFMNILFVKEITNISAITKKKFKAMGMIRFDCLADVNVPENKNAVLQFTIDDIRL